MTAGFHTEEMTLNMGPHHPSTHGVLRFILKTDGEVMRVAEPDVGYLHRSIEKIAEKIPYQSFVPWTDRVDYLAAINCNVGYAMAVEKLAGIEISRRAEYLRVITMELNRIASHLIGVGSAVMDIGAYTPFLHMIREREKANDLMEELCGQRLTHHYARIGGVAFDLPEGFEKRILSFLNGLEKSVDEFNRLISYNKIYLHRMGGIGVISSEDAISYNLVGPNLRGSGIKWDLRKDEPYSAYNDFDFDVPVGTGEAGVLGDCFDRYMIRVKEIVESAKIIRQAIASMPAGEIMVKLPKRLRPPPGEVYVRTESARGDLGMYLVSDGTDKPYRLKIRTGSFTAMGIVEKVSRGMMIADLVALIASLDVIAPEVDR